MCIHTCVRICTHTRVYRSVCVCLYLNNSSKTECVNTINHIVRHSSTTEDRHMLSRKPSLLSTLYSLSFLFDVECFTLSWVLKSYIWNEEIRRDSEVESTIATGWLSQPGEGVSLFVCGPDPKSLWLPTSPLLTS